MDFTSSLIGPESSATAAAPASPAAPSLMDVGQLAELPPVRALLEGKPAAIYAEEGINTPLTQTIGQNFKKIGELGLALYRSPNKKMIMFNPQAIDVNELRQADNEGKLDSVAISLEAFEAGGAPTAAQTAASAPAPQPGVAPAPLTKGLTPRAQSKLAGTRIGALMDDESPSKRKVPGGGKILNSLMERAI